jgi:hypothetical protein
MAHHINLKSLAKLVSWLDGYASLSSTDPLRVEKLVKEIEASGQAKKGKDTDPSGKEVAELWQQVRKDVYDIANLPGESEDIMKVSKRVGIAKILIPFLGAGVVLAFLLLNIFGILPMSDYSRVVVIILAIVAYNASLILFMAYNRRLSARVDDYYKKHSGELANQRKHVKATVQKLITILASGVRSRGLEPNSVRFSLLNSDYHSIVVLGSDKEGARKTVIVKGKEIPKT